MLKSFFSAFLMYSRIPMPNVEWKEENRRYSLGFFPLVGAVIGTILLIWRYLCTELETGQFIFGAGAVSIPILVTGGIHLDGFCDVTDARSSYADREKRLAIMSDPHIGSFAVIRLCLYLIIQTALFSAVDSMKLSGLIACGYVVSRGLSGISAIIFRSAKNEGTLQSFVHPSQKKITIAMLCFLILLCGSAMIIMQPVEGVSALVITLIVLAYHRYTSYRDFGGITGDLCGWFLQVCELSMLAAIVFSERILHIW